MARQSPLVLKLLNAKRILIQAYWKPGLYFHWSFSSKCKELELRCIHNIDKKWCDFIINNCDCSGIKNLVVDRVIKTNY